MREGTFPADSHIFSLTSSLRVYPYQVMALILLASDNRDHMTTHQDYKLSLQAFQSQRLRRDLADLAAESQYEQIGKFFFEEMYGSRDFSARDEQAQRAHWFVHRVPGVTAHDVESVLDLLALTDRLDDEITDMLIAP